MHTYLRESLRSHLGREPIPSAVPVHENKINWGERGYDGEKELSDRKRHIVTDTLGLIIRVKVHTADIQDRVAVLCAFNIQPLSRCA
jgi:putative transposase